MPRRPALPALALALALAALPARAPAAGQEARLAALALAAGLHRVARARNDALALLAAARIRRAAGGADWAAMLADAARAARGDALLAALIADEAAAAARGGEPRGLPGSRAVLPPGETHVWSLPLDEVFAAGGRAEVYVEGSGTTDLDIEILGPGGPICIAAGRGDIAYCAWRPAGPEPATIRITNRGGQDNRYWIITN